MRMLGSRTAALALAAALGGGDVLGIASQMAPMSPRDVERHKREIEEKHARTCNDAGYDALINGVESRQVRRAPKRKSRK